MKKGQFSALHPGNTLLRMTTRRGRETDAQCLDNGLVVACSYAVPGDSGALSRFRLKEGKQQVRGITLILLLIGVDRLPVAAG